MSYRPKSGINAGKRNFKEIENYLRENPDCTGVQIAKALKLSIVTVYKHLKKLQKDYK